MPFIQIGPVVAIKQAWVQAESLRAPGSNPASFEDLGISGVWQFADNLVKIIIGKISIPKDMDRTKDADFDLGWSTPATSKVCRWQLEYLLRSPDEDMSAAAEVTLTQDETCSATANGLNISVFDIPAANIADADSCLLFRLSRLGNHFNDTLDDVANLSGLCLHYTSNKRGDPV